MTARQILASSFKKLRAATPTLREPKQIVAAGILTNGAIGRICNAETNVGIDVLDQIAAAYGLEPWQLLMPSLAASPSHSGAPTIIGTPQWPFELFSPEDFARLGQKERENIENMIAGAIQRASR